MIYLGRAKYNLLFLLHIFHELARILGNPNIKGRESILVWISDTWDKRSGTLVDLFQTPRTQHPEIKQKLHTFKDTSLLFSQRSDRHNEQSQKFLIFIFGLHEMILGNIRGYVCFSST